MSIYIIIFLILIAFLAIFFLIGFFTMNLNDFFDLIVAKTLWVWLPIHALISLSKELREKYSK